MLELGFCRVMIYVKILKMHPLLTAFWPRAFHIGDQQSSTNKNLISTFIKNPRDHLSQELVIVALIVVEYPNIIMVF